MYVLDGTLVITNKFDKIEVFKTEGGFVIPKDWTGTLAVSAGGVRKVRFACMGGKKVYEVYI